MKYGSKYNCARGYVHLLFPTAELWSLSLPHRTQILYATDIGRIVFELDLSPGKVICESGTGSGSLRLVSARARVRFYRTRACVMCSSEPVIHYFFSHALIRAIAPSGHLHTVEFHSDRAKLAAAEFKEHGIDDFVTVYNRDVITDGFPNEIDHMADAVFLDIPAPYSAIHHVKRALKISGGEFCNFSPCIEQVQQMCNVLRKNGFVEVKTIEVVNHSMTVKTTAMAIPDFGVDIESLVKQEILPDFDHPDIGYFTKVWPWNLY